MIFPDIFLIPVIWNMIRNQLRSLNYGIILSFDSAVIILLNRNLGGGIITNHQIHQGISMHSGTLEHMCINPDGPLCYCGSRGCLETYCSANALEQAAGIPAKEFFPLLREKKSPQIIQIWKDFLNHLAFA